MTYQEPEIRIVSFLEEIVRTSYVVEDDFGEFND